jgi:hypothetical protein
LEIQLHCEKSFIGCPIPEDLFQTFAEVAEHGIDLPKYFFIDFIRDQEQVEFEV